MSDWRHHSNDDWLGWTTVDGEFTFRDRPYTGDRIAPPGLLEPLRWHEGMAERVYHPEPVRTWRVCQEGHYRWWVVEDEGPDCPECRLLGGG